MIFWPLERAKISICRRLIRRQSLLDRTFFTLFKQNCIGESKAMIWRVFEKFLKIQRLLWFRLPLSGVGKSLRAVQTGSQSGLL